MVVVVGSTEIEWVKMKMKIGLVIVAVTLSLFGRLSGGLETKVEEDLPRSGVGACDCLSDGLLLHTGDPSCRSYCSCESGTGTVLQCPVNTFFNAKSQSCENVSMLEHAHNCRDSVEFANLNVQRRSDGGHSHRTLLGRSDSRRAAQVLIISSGTPFLLSLITREVFYQLFKYGTNSSFCREGSKIFQYDAFAMAALAYPRLGGVGSLVIRRREIAAFLAQIARETTGGWPTAPGGPAAWGLCFHEEIFCSEGGGGFGSQPCRYCDNSSILYPCAPGKSYKGRGPIQLSWNYNYGLIGQLMGLRDQLLLNPDLVAQDGTISFKTAMQFWMAPQLPKPSCHDVMVGRWRPSRENRQLGRLPGFGMTTNIINGGLECGPGNTGNPTQADRVRYFEHFCKLLGVDPGPNLFCANMAPYG